MILRKCLCSLTYVAARGVLSRCGLALRSGPSTRTGIHASGACAVGGECGCWLRPWGRRMTFNLRALWSDRLVARAGSRAPGNGLPIIARLSLTPDDGSITVGFAQLVRGDSPMDLIDRADRQLIAARNTRNQEHDDFLRLH